MSLKKCLKPPPSIFLVWVFTVTWVDFFQLHVKRLGNNTQRIHAWYIYLHLVDFTHVGKYTKNMDPVGNVIFAMLGRNICRKTSLFHQIRHSGIWKTMPTYCCNAYLTTYAAKMNSVNDRKCMQWFHIGSIPRCSMYGIFTYIWLKFIVNVGIYTWSIWDMVSPSHDQHYNLGQFSLIHQNESF